MSLVAAPSAAVARARVGAERFPHLLSPLRVRNVTFQNKLFFAPMGIDLAGHDGAFSPALGDFYTGIMQGGCGSLILSNATVSRDSILLPKALRMFDGAHAAALRPFIQQCNAAGVIAGIQLQHYGGQGTTTYTRGKPLLTPSAVPSKALQKLDPRYRVREMTLDDIQAVKQEFVESALLSAGTGVQLIQLQASNGYLLSSFLSPFTNRRTDAYGGSNIRRAQLLIEIIDAVRRAVGDGVVIGVRIGIDDCLAEGGMVPENLQDAIPLLEDAGADLFEASICVADTFYKLSDQTGTMAQYLKQQVRKVKSYSRVPVGFAGMVEGLETAERLIADGTADMIGMARALFADNDLLIKTVENREADIHKCLWDGKCFKDKYNPRFDRVYCCVNPKYKRPE